MNSVLSSVSYYYRNELGSSTHGYGDQERYVVIRDPLTRFEFVAGSVFALIYAINELVQTVFSLVAILFTLGANQSHRDSFMEHLYGIAVYVVAWPAGLVGGIAPEFINRALVGIPPEGIRRVLTTREEIRAWHNTGLIW